ncbi:hypothetical protein ACFLVE_03810 [Chloroflexota bacterium]
MTIGYKEIDKFGDEAFEWYKGILQNECLIYGGILELFLESVKPLGGYNKDTDYMKMALLTLATRLVNDAEGASHLLLRGLPTQAQMIMRDIIESSMLFRLFLKDRELAKRWIVDLTEYFPISAYKKLSEMKIPAKEYAFYSILSNQAHSNFLSSISNIQEDGEGTRRTYHFGSSRTPETIFFVQHSFVILFYLFYLLLTEPLSEYYSQNSGPKLYSAWVEKVDKLKSEMETLAEAAGKSTVNISNLDKDTLNLVAKKVRFNKIKQRLSGNMDEVIENE